MEQYLSGLTKLGTFITNYYDRESGEDELYEEFDFILKRTKVENPWFTPKSLEQALKVWADLFQSEELISWVNHYPSVTSSKRIGLILAGNVPMVGWHDVMSVLVSGHTAVIKLSSKDKHLIPFLLKLWNEYSSGKLQYEFVERLENFEAVIATGSNNTARYLTYYFKDYPSIIRKNRTSLGVLDGSETNEEIQALAQDIFQYYGMGCRNISKLFIPKDFELSRLFENFLAFGEHINHHSYANNYDYNKAIYLLNQEQFWDNNFVMLKEDESLFSPLSVIHFTRYENVDEVKNFINKNEENIQCVVSKNKFQEKIIPLGKAQQPSLMDYADHIDTMQFLRGI